MNFQSTAKPLANLRPASRGERARLALPALAVLLGVAVLVGIGVGAVSLSPLQTVAILLKQFGVSLPVTFEAQQEAVLLAIRLPRVCLGIMVGAGLAVAGASMQGMFRNPLADPGLIGVSGGAALAAVAVIVLGARAGAHLPPTLQLAVLPLAAFAGGFAVTLLVYRLSRAGGHTATGTMLLAGIAVNAFAGACIGLMTFISTDAQLRSITFWSLGSLGGATWTSVLVVMPFIIIPVLLLPRLARSLNALLLGEAEAKHLGVDTERVKRAAIILTAMAVGASVAVAGIIGFVGLVVPHLLRLSLGPDHRTLLPGAALLGAALLVGADTVARSVVIPAELPIGIVTALVGAPFFLWLLLRGRQSGSAERGDVL